MNQGNATVTVDYPAVVLRCHLCPNRRPEKAFYQLEGHFRDMHDRTVSYRCVICHREETVKKVMAAHYGHCKKSVANAPRTKEDIHKNGNGGNFACPSANCARSFASQRGLSQHLRKCSPEIYNQGLPTKAFPRVTSQYLP